MAGMQDESPKQPRITLDEDLSAVVQERKLGSGKTEASKFVNNCLRAYFLSKGWIKESREPGENSPSPDKGNDA